MAEQLPAGKLFHPVGRAGEEGVFLPKLFIALPGLLCKRTEIRELPDLLFVTPDAGGEARGLLGIVTCGLRQLCGGVFPDGKPELLRHVRAEVIEAPDADECKEKYAQRQHDPREPRENAAAMVPEHAHERVDQPQHRQQHRDLPDAERHDCRHRGDRRQHLAGESGIECKDHVRRGARSGDHHAGQNQKNC